jgi:hypothetical protein
MLNIDHLAAHAVLAAMLPLYLMHVDRGRDMQ